MMAVMIIIMGVDIDDIDDDSGDRVNFLFSRYTYYKYDICCQHYISSIGHI